MQEQRYGMLRNVRGIQHVLHAVVLISMPSPTILVIVTAQSLKFMYIFPSKLCLTIAVNKCTQMYERKQVHKLVTHIVSKCSNNI